MKSTMLEMSVANVSRKSAVPSNFQSSIFINFNETIVQLIPDGDSVKVDRSDSRNSKEVPIYRFRSSAVCTAEPGNLYDVARRSIREFMKNGTIETDEVKLTKTELDPPDELLSIRCKTFSSTFLEPERTKKWLRLVEGPLEILNVSGMNAIKGIGGWDQVKNVEEQLVLVSCDMTDEEVKGLGAKSFAIESENITENGAMTLLQVCCTKPTVAIRLCYRNGSSRIHLATAFKFDSNHLPYFSKQTYSRIWKTSKFRGMRSFGADLELIVNISFLPGLN